MIPLERAASSSWLPGTRAGNEISAMMKGDESKCIREKSHGRARSGDHQTGDRWADQTRAMEDRAIERNRAGDLLALHQLRHERGERRMFKRKGDP